MGHPEPNVDDPSPRRLRAGGREELRRRMLALISWAERRRSDVSSVLEELSWSSQKGCTSVLQRRPSPSRWDCASGGIYESSLSETARKTSDEVVGALEADEYVNAGANVL